jgi:hypothetical protein
LTPAVIEPECPLLASDTAEVLPSVQPMELGMAPQCEADPAAPAVEGESDNDDTVETTRGQRRSLVDKVRDWLRRAA